MRTINLALAALASLAAGCQSLWVDSNPGQGEHPSEPLGSFYALPKGLVTLRISADEKKELTGKPLVLNADTPRLVPDPAHYYRVGASFSAFAEDEITVTTTKEGLLTAVNTKTTDQSLAAVNKLIELVTEAAKAASGARHVQGMGMTGTTADSALVTKAQEELDPTDCEAVERFARLAAGATGQAVTVKVRRPSLDASLTSNGEVKVCPERESTQRRACSRGICFRPLLPYTITACMTAACDPADRGELTVLLPNDGPLLSIDIVRRPFVETTANYTFDNTTGIVTSATLKKPSEVVGFLSIPVAIVKAIVEIPSAILNFKVTRLGDQKELLDAQAALLESQAKLIEALKN